MSDVTLYLKLEQKVEVKNKSIYLNDICQLLCTDHAIEEKAKSLLIQEFSHEEIRIVISILKIIECIYTLSDDLIVISIGEPDILIELIKDKKPRKFLEIIKIIFVSMICFFGTAFTIMAFHNDIGINKVFRVVYKLIMGKESNGFTILEISYSIGLALGIILFFNHVGGRKITKDPTPIEVEMRLYENDVNTALIQIADREGIESDVKK